MKISGIAGTGGTKGPGIPAGQMALSQEADPVSKSIQKQIAKAQEELQGTPCGQGECSCCPYGYNSLFLHIL